MILESKCMSCQHCKYYPAKTYGDPNECYPAEWECKAESDNFMTDDGCYRYEENILDRD